MIWIFLIPINPFAPLNLTDTSHPSSTSLISFFPSFLLCISFFSYPRPTPNAVV